MAKKSQKTVRTAVKKYLSEKKRVSFAYLFGSFAKNDVYRDIDVAIFFKSKPDLLKLGEIQAELQSLIPETPVDMLLLNDLINKKPVLAQQVITKGALLINNDPENHGQFKEKTMQVYFDTAYLRKLMDEAFANRLEKGEFGARNYA